MIREDEQLFIGIGLGLIAGNGSREELPAAGWAGDAEAGDEGPGLVIGNGEIFGIDLLSRFGCGYCFHTPSLAQPGSLVIAERKTRPFDQYVALIGIGCALDYVCGLPTEVLHDPAGGLDKRVITHCDRDLGFTDILPAAYRIPSVERVYFCEYIPAHTAAQYGLPSEHFAGCVIGGRRGREKGLDKHRGAEFPGIDHRPLFSHWSGCGYSLSRDIFLHGVHQPRGSIR